MKKLLSINRYTKPQLGNILISCKLQKKFAIEKPIKHNEIASKKFL